MRGEYGGLSSCGSVIMELPPRARRIPQTTRGAVSPTRTTSACAENTHLGLKQSNSPRNYLRVRGEYEIEMIEDSFAQELPPRARRIPPPLHHRYQTNGTTSACAENTHTVVANNCGLGNYLRVRGEYLCVGWLELGRLELPPRARRIHPGRYCPEKRGGTTSACAENT